VDNKKVESETIEQEIVQEEPKNTVKRNVKDSVFTDLFRIEKYQFRLYQDLHPEDKTTTEGGITNVTIKNVMTDKVYNDLGFIVGNRFVILVEAQTTWSMNILIRVLIYIAQTYHEYFMNTKQNLYSSTKVEIPKPEIYVVYTGERDADKPDTISLSKEFFKGKKVGIEVEAKVIYESDDDSILNQYIKFTKVYDEQRKKYGRKQEAILETIRICKDKNILKEYLESRESEVITIMMSLYDEEEVMKIYVESEKNDLRCEMAKNMINDGKLSLETIAQYSGLPIKEVKELQSKMMQPVG
jgi:predicted HTH domain antitoxin